MAVEEITMQPSPFKTKPVVPLYTHDKNREDRYTSPCSDRIENHNNALLNIIPFSTIRHTDRRLQCRILKGMTAPVAQCSFQIFKDTPIANVPHDIVIYSQHHLYCW